MAKRIPLDNVCEKKVATLSTQYDGLIDYVDISSVDNVSKRIVGFQTLSAKDAPSRAKQLLEVGDILVSTVRPNLNAVAMVEKREDNLLVGSTGYCVLRCKDAVDRRFIFHFCQSPYFVDDMTAQATGASYPAVTSGIVKNSCVPAYPIGEQRQIAKKLDKLSELITLRKEQLAKLDELVKSRFVEQFGNFVHERDRWSICEVGDVADTIDPQPSHRTPPTSADGIPYIGIAECNYKTRLIDFEKARKVGRNVLQEHLERYILDEGDFIIGKIGTIGKPFFVPAEQTYTLSANTVLIKPHKGQVSPQFLFAVFQSEYMDRIIDAEKKSTSQPAFGIQKVRKIIIPLPPLELQELFATYVVETNKTKLTIQSSLDKLEVMKKALMQEYFG